MRDLQEVFNIIWERAKNPVKAQSSDVFGEVECSYRDANGLACFLGECIDEDDYNPDMEGQDVASLKEFFEEEFTRSFGNINIPTLSTLQCIHDWSHPHQWKEDLIKFAETAKLKVPE